MQRGHGDADLLIAEEHVDLRAFDEAVASGGADREAARLVAGNKFLGPNRFGKMFPDLEPFRPSDEALDELGRAMRELSPQDPAFNNSDIPAGVTYLGQFIDHDITRDPTEGFPPIDDPDEIRQARTPTLDLDSLYGLGPKRQRELYEDRLRPGRARFKIGRTSSVATSGGIGVPDIPGLMPNDLPRRPDKSAIIGDSRNDENTIVAQTHLAFLKFHNRVMDRSPRDGGRVSTLQPSGGGRRAHLLPQGEAAREVALPVARPPRLPPQARRPGRARRRQDQRPKVLPIRGAVRWSTRSTPILSLSSPTSSVVC